MIQNDSAWFRGNHVTGVWIWPGYDEMGNAVWQALQVYNSTHILCRFSPHLCVGFLFLVLHFRLPPPPPPPLRHTPPPHMLTHNLLTHTHNLLTHTTCPPTSCSPHNLSPHNLSTHNLLTHNLLTHNLLTTQLVTTQLVHTRLNVGLWLVARFAIVAILSKLFWNPCIVWRVHFCGKKWDSFFQKKQPVIAERKTFFPKKIAKFKLQAFPKGANPLLNPY